MKEKEKDYYTAGELAKLFHIPKQTMLYYDKMGNTKAGICSGKWVPLLFHAPIPYTGNYSVPSKDGYFCAGHP